MNVRRLMALTTLAVIASAPIVYAEQSTSVTITRIGNKNLAAVASQPATVRRAQTQKPRLKPELLKPKLQTLSALRAKISAPVPTSMPVVRPGGGFVGFDALDSNDSYLSGGGISEPPDQGLASSGTQELEAINTVLSVYSPTGKRLLTPVSLYDFFSVPLSDPDGNEYILSDPRVYFDAATNRWFVSILRYVVDPNTFQFVPGTGSTVLLGVSTARDAKSDYNIYEIDVSDASHSGCPCLGDQPLIGANQDGIFLEVNEYSTSNLHFITAQIIALEKAALAHGESTVGAAGFDDLQQAEGPGFSVQPAITAPYTSTSQNNGTEYFVSSLDFAGTVDNRLTVWSMTNTKSLKNASPSVHLHKRVITVTPYGQPPAAKQKAGPTPLGDQLGEPEEQLETNDDRLQQVYYANGRLYTALTTVVLSKDANPPRAGIAYFVLSPTASSTSVSAKVTKQGYIAVYKQNVMFPAVAVGKSGQGVIGFSMSGSRYFPSTAYVTVNGASVAGSVHLAGAGTAPEDGFSGYAAFGGNGVARWGDYSAAAISPGGQVWFASEYIPDASTRPRTPYTNWGTHISRTH
jgi:hypothetical protein